MGASQEQQKQEKWNSGNLESIFVVFFLSSKFESEMSAALAFDQKCLELGLNDRLNSVRFPEDFAPFQQQTKKFLTKSILENQQQKFIFADGNENFMSESDSEKCGKSPTAPVKSSKWEIFFEPMKQNLDSGL